ncbi:hypothetical protein JTB14_011867, partial [Gonioctena quinquepunctata]
SGLRWTHMLITHADTSTFSCKVQPEIGYAAKTEFHVNCDIKVVNRKFEIFSSNVNELLLASGPKVEDLPFILSFNDKVKVKLTDQLNLHTDFAVVDVTVKSILENVTSNEKLNVTLQKLFFDEHSNKSLIGLMNSTKYDQKMQTFMALANEFASLPKNDTYEETIKVFEIKMMDMMEKGVLLKK